MKKIIYVELRRLTSNRKNDKEMEFLASRYKNLKNANFLPDDLESNQYEDIRHLIVGGWVNALSCHLRDYESAVVFVLNDNGPYSDLDKEVNDETVFMISIMSGNFIQARNLINYLRKEYTSCPIIIGGVHPTLCAEESFSILQPDYMIVGDGDEIIKDLIQNAFDYKPFFAPGIWNKGYEKPSIARSVASVSNYEWSWELHDKYSHPMNKNIVNYVSTRSCPFNCHFCGIVKNKYEEVAPKKIISQLTDLKNHYDNVWVHLESPCCFYDKEMAQVTYSTLKDLKIKFSGQHRIEEPTEINRKIYNMAADAGMDNIFVGIESMQDKVLTSMNKRNKSKLVEPCLQALTESGITVNSGWIIGIPGQTDDDVRRDIEAAVNLITKKVMAVALPQYLEIYPGTWFWNNAKELGITLNCDVNSYDKISKQIAHRTRELSEEKIWSLYCEFLSAVQSVI